MNVLIRNISLPHVAKFMAKRVHMMKLKAILVRDIDRIIAVYRADISAEKNRKANTRLLEEQAMYKYVLRNAPQTTVERTTIKVRHMAQM